MRLFRLIAIMALIVFVSYGRSDAQKRAPFTLKITDDQGKGHVEKFDSTDIIMSGNKIRIFSDETLYIEMQIEGSKLVPVRRVDKIRDSSITVVISLGQIKEKDHRPFMMLTVSNPFNRDLIYKAKMYLVAGNDWYDTSIVPVKSHATGMEFWVNAISSLLLRDFALTDKK